MLLYSCVERGEARGAGGAMHGPTFEKFHLH